MSRSAYTYSFARIYDDIMSGVPYDLWYEYLNELLSFYNEQPRKILDLACGTGNMTYRFAEKGKKVVGLDGSEQMLAVAQKKMSDSEGRIEFVQADLRDFSLPYKFDFVFSVFDSINYILTRRGLRKVFANVKQVLEDDGIFIFDMNTIHRLMSIEPGSSLFTGENYSCVWMDRVDESSKKWSVKLKIKLKGEENGYYEELHEETSYPLSDVKALLKETGFKEVDVYKAFTFSTANDSNNRVYFAAKKEPMKTSVGDLIKKKITWFFSKLFRYGWS